VRGSRVEEKGRGAAVEKQRGEGGGRQYVGHVCLRTHTCLYDGNCSKSSLRHHHQNNNKCTTELDGVWLQEHVSQKLTHSLLMRRAKLAPIHDHDECSASISLGNKHTHTYTYIRGLHYTMFIGGKVSHIFCLCIVKWTTIATHSLHPRKTGQHRHMEGPLILAVGGNQTRGSEIRTTTTTQ
jgi:hypothetical protein